MRHLEQRRAPVRGQVVTERTTLDDLFTVWIASKVTEDGIKAQTEHSYRQTWINHGSGQLGALRIAELLTSQANAHIQSVAATAPTTAGYLRIILRGMYGLAARFDVIDRNPITETRTAKVKRKAAACGDRG